MVLFRFFILLCAFASFFSPIQLQAQDSGQSPNSEAYLSKKNSSHQIDLVYHDPAEFILDGVLEESFWENVPFGLEPN